MRSSRIDEQMAVLVESLRELRGDVRAVRAAIETCVAAQARHVARTYSHLDYREGAKCAHCGKAAQWIVEDIALCGKCATRTTTAHKT